MKNKETILAVKVLLFYPYEFSPVYIFLFELSTLKFQLCNQILLISCIVYTFNFKYILVKNNFFPKHFSAYVDSKVLKQLNLYGYTPKHNYKCLSCSTFRYICVQRFTSYVLKKIISL